MWQWLRWAADDPCTASLRFCANHFCTVARYGRSLSKSLCQNGIRFNAYARARVRVCVCALFPCPFARSSRNEVRSHGPTIGTRARARHHIADNNTHTQTHTGTASAEQRHSICIVHLRTPQPPNQTAPPQHAAFAAMHVCARIAPCTIPPFSELFQPARKHGHCVAYTKMKKNALTITVARIGTIACASRSPRNCEWPAGFPWSA